MWNFRYSTILYLKKTAISYGLMDKLDFNKEWDKVTCEGDGREEQEA